MELILEVISYKGLPPVGLANARFTEHGGSIGRSADNHLALPDAEKFISRHHANIRFESGRFVLQDVSTAGTWLCGEGRWLTQASVPLVDGDVIKIGEYELRARIESAQQDVLAGLFDKPPEQMAPSYGQAPEVVPLDPFGNVPPPLPLGPLPPPKGSQQDFPTFIGQPEAAPFEESYIPPGIQVTPPPNLEVDFSIDNFFQDSFEPPRASQPSPALPQAADFDLDQYLGNGLELPEQPSLGPSAPLAEAAKPDSASFFEPAKPDETLADLKTAAMPGRPENVSDPFIHAPAPPAGEDIFAFPAVDAVPPPAHEPAALELPKPPPSTPTSLDDFFGIPAGDAPPPVHDEAAPAEIPKPLPSTPDSLEDFFSASEADAVRAEPTPLDIPKAPPAPLPLEQDFFASPATVAAQPMPHQAVHVEIPKPVPAAPASPINIPKPGRPSSLPPAAVAEPTPAASPPPTQQPPPSAPAPAGAGPALDLFRSFLEGAGLPDLSSMTPEEQKKAMRVVGMTYREMVDGMMQVLLARKMEKSMIALRRTDVTVVQARENNPLKVFPTVEETMVEMVCQKNPAYIGPAESVREGFADIMKHQMAMRAGMQAALDGFLKRLDPKIFEERYKEGIVFQKKAKCWDAYCHDYPKLVNETLDDLFGDEFAEAYREQLRILRDPKR